MTQPSRREARLRAGDWAEVRGPAEILATLDANGRLDGLPFMPEMLACCGRRVRVYRSAHKTCDTIQSYRSRGMHDAVHLDGLRCDGSAHDGCQAACLLFWKGAWLRSVTGPDAESPVEGGSPRSGPEAETPAARIDADGLLRATRAPLPPDAAGEEAPAEADRVRYCCQATELRNATFPLGARDPRHYWKDLSSRNVGLGGFLLGLAIAAFNVVMRMHRRGHPFPYIRGQAGEKTPTTTLDLQPGELVRVRSKSEIMTTINRQQRNRGLWFDAEMVPFCGKAFRVRSRVDRIINEQTGAMIRLPTTCITLEGVVCGGRLSQGRLFCPRSIYPYWREIWLQRVDADRGRTRPSAEVL